MSLEALHHLAAAILNIRFATSDARNLLTCPITRCKWNYETGLTGVFAHLTVAEPSTMLLTAAMSRDMYQQIAVYIFGSTFLVRGSPTVGLAISS